MCGESYLELKAEVRVGLLFLDACWPPDIFKCIIGRNFDETWFHLGGMGI
jgi:hypothetical protein